MHKATIIRTDGFEADMGRRPTLEEAQKVVGGYIEFIRIKGNRTLVVNEEGRCRHLPLNSKATDLYGTNHERIVGIGIVGDVILLEGWRTVGN